MASSVHYYSLKVQFALSSKMDATALNEALDQVKRDLFSSSQSQQQQWPQPRWQLRKRPRQGSSDTLTPTPAVPATKQAGAKVGVGAGAVAKEELPMQLYPKVTINLLLLAPLDPTSQYDSASFQQFYFPKLVTYSYTDLKVNC